MLSNSLLILNYASPLPEHSWGLFPLVAQTMSLPSIWKAILTGGSHLISLISRDRDIVTSAESENECNNEDNFMEIQDHLETRTTWEWSKRNHLDLSLQAHLLLPETSCLTSVC